MRPAARAWEEDYATRLIAIGFRRGKASATTFTNDETGIRIVVHGDDFTLLGYEEDLKALAELMKTWYELVVRGMLGPDERDDKEIEILNRTIRWEPEGIRITADPKHAKNILEKCGLEANSKSLTCPGTKDDQAEEGDEEDLQGGEATEYRAVAATANYLAQDKPDIQYSAKELCMRMAKPKKADWRRAKRLARYLIKNGVTDLWYENQEEQKTLVCYSDSDWAGCLESRKSTSGGLIAHGTHCIQTWSVTQKSVALSSGEAEFYSAIEAGSRALGLQSVAEGLGWKMSVEVKTDASAAEGAMNRSGLGKMRHMETKYLWMQDLTATGRMHIAKVPRKDNPADILTHFLTAAEMRPALEKVGVQMKQTQAEPPERRKWADIMSDEEDDVWPEQ
jgi:hypothetical protein